MPYSITTRDGITINNIPDNVPADAQELKDRVAKLRQNQMMFSDASVPQPSPKFDATRTPVPQAPYKFNPAETEVPQPSAPFDPASTPVPVVGQSQLERPVEEPPKTTLGGIAGGVARGFAIPATGAALGAAYGGIPGAITGAGAATLGQTIGDPIVGAVNSMFGTNFARPTDAMERLLSRMGIPNPRTEAERLVQASITGAGGAGGIAAAGKSLQSIGGPVTRRVSEMVASQPASQIMGGAGAGAAAQATREMGFSPVAELGASLAGGVAGAKSVPQPRIPLTAAAEATKEATSRGINVLTSDVAPPSTFVGKIAQRAGERIPVAGTGGARSAQQEQRAAAVMETLRQYGADTSVDVSSQLMKSLTAKRSADFKKYAAQKESVISGLTGTSDLRVMPKIPKTIATIDEQIADLSKRNTEGANEAIARLQKIRQDIQGRNLSQLEAYRKDELSKAFADDPARPMSIAAREVGESALRKIYDPLREDMGDFIKATGGKQNFNKWMVANKRLSELAGEVNAETFRSVIKSGQETPENINKLLFSKKPSELRIMSRNLTEDGKANARTAILSEAAKKAEATLNDGTVIFRPDTFNAEIKRLRPQIDVFFGEADKKQIEGLSRALSLTRRARDAGTATATGQEAAPFLAGSFLHSIAGTLAGAVGMAGGVAGVARAYESSPVRNLMLKLGEAAPGSAEEAALFKRLVSVVQNYQPKEQQ